MRSAAISDIGLVRVRNEDAFWCDSRRGIFLIADGIGGQQAGEVAASMAIEIVSADLTLAVDRGLKDTALADAVHDSFTEASREIYQRAQQSENLRGMACSLIAAVIRGSDCLISHVGDARAYLCMENALHQITVDDTPVAVMVKRGYLLPEKARSHILKNVLIKSVGNKPQVDANLTLLPLKQGEKLLLCSDGLWGMVEEKDIFEIISSAPDPEAACHNLVVRARDNGGKDNITVILVEVDHPSQSASRGSTTQIMPQSVI